MSLVPRHCATRCERRHQTPHCTTWFLIRRAAVRLPSVPTVYLLSFSQQLGSSQMSLCSIIIAMETTRAHVPLIIATVQESYFSSPATPLRVKCPSSGSEAVFLPSSPKGDVHGCVTAPLSLSHCFRDLVCLFFFFSHL